MAPTSSSKKTVVVVGLGYAGMKVASKLDGAANVIAIDRHSHFFHTFSGPHAITDAAFTERVRPRHALAPDPKLPPTNSDIR